MYKRQFYDFEAKYLSDRDVELVCPADVPDDVASEIQRLAAEAFSALGCEGLARVDCFYTDTGRVIINEINTMPGFTPHSMYPRMWAASVLDYEALVDELIELAMTRRTGPVSYTQLDVYKRQLLRNALTLAPRGSPKSASRRRRAEHTCAQQSW